MNRQGWESPPKDPLLYRLYEVGPSLRVCTSLHELMAPGLDQILVVYGFPLKSIIHEKFGDGIVRSS